MTDFGWLAIAAAVLGLFLFLRFRGLIGTRRARAAVAEGAVVLDVRSPAEFSGGALPGVRNVPLDELESRVREVVPDRDKIVLCHCVSGMRSGAAVARLRRLGYRRAYNLGSFTRAAGVLRRA